MTVVFNSQTKKTNTMGQNVVEEKSDIHILLLEHFTNSRVFRMLLLMLHAFPRTTSFSISPQKSMSRDLKAAK